MRQNIVVSNNAAKNVLSRLAGIKHSRGVSREQWEMQD